MPRSGDASRASVRRNIAGGVDERDLAHLGLGVARKQRLERLLGAVTRPHEIESERPEADIHHRLRGHGADARQRPRHHRADLEIVRLHGDP